MLRHILYYIILLLLYYFIFLLYYFILYYFIIIILLLYILLLYYFIYIIKKFQIHFVNVFEYSYALKTLTRPSELTIEHSVSYKSKRTNNCVDLAGKLSIFRQTEIHAQLIVTERITIGRARSSNHTHDWLQRDKIERRRACHRV